MILTKRKLKNKMIPLKDTESQDTCQEKGFLIYCEMYRTPECSMDCGYARSVMATKSALNLINLQSRVQ